jgi:hypothetical protein
MVIEMGPCVIGHWSHNGSRPEAAFLESCRST